MTVGRTWTVALDGVAGRVVRVEADLSNGLPAANVIGTGDAASAQAKDRIRAAVHNSGHKFPDTRVTLALSPASLPKKGAGYDVAMAIALLAAAEVVPAAAAERCVLIGELGLDGTIRAVPGVLPLLIAALVAGRRDAVVPVENLAEAALSGARVCGAASLADLVGHLNGEQLLVPAPAPGEIAARPVPDLADVLGQPEARRALELAAAGGHHLVMIGPPGAGKTMLAKRLPGILPALDDCQAMAVTAIHSVAGMLDVTSPLIRRPPFIDPHHSASLPAMVGGGSGLIRPGAASLAHHGVLFLDEAPEFKPTVLDSLRQSLEDREVRVSRSNRTVTFPARFQLVVAANPCPCAAARDIDCSCAAGVRRKYLGRLSGPLLDRVDIRVPVAPLSVEALISRGVRGESSAVVAGRVARARARAAQRWSDPRWAGAAGGAVVNGSVPGPVVRAYWDALSVDRRAVDDAVRVGRLTGRGYDRVLRLALTSADLADRAMPERADLFRALAMRCGEEL